MSIFQVSMKDTVTSDLTLSLFLTPNTFTALSVDNDLFKISSKDNGTSLSVFPVLF